MLNFNILGHIATDINVKHTVKVVFVLVYKDDSVEKFFRFQLILYGFTVMLSTQIGICFIPNYMQCVNNILHKFYL